MIGSRPLPVPETPPTSSTEGRLVYAIGDIHGRADLFVQMVNIIRKDAAQSRSGSRPVVVLLGDYVDRGPRVKEVVELASRLPRSTDFEGRVLKGNHEEVMLAFLDDATVGRAWAQHGGRETLASYGIPPPHPRADDEAWEAARLALLEALPPSHLSFLRSLELQAEYGDYLFVHAGVRPGVALEAQEERDLLWIRRDFLGQEHGLGRVVVHGHTPSVEPHLDGERIGLDTGAYATGILTGIRLLNTERKILQARPGPR